LSQNEAGDTRIRSVEPKRPNHRPVLSRKSWGADSLDRFCQACYIRVKFQPRKECIELERIHERMPLSSRGSWSADNSCSVLAAEAAESRFYKHYD
jgi:hypothetical protein